MKVIIKPSTEDYYDYYNEIVDSLHFLIDMTSVGDTDMEEGLKALWTEATEKKEEYEEMLNKQWEEEERGQIIEFNKMRL
jgi:hypothetical protein